MTSTVKKVFGVFLEHHSCHGKHGNSLEHTRPRRMQEMPYKLAAGQRIYSFELQRAVFSVCLQGLSIV